MELGPKARDEWKEVFSTIQGLWPNQYAKNWTGIINDTWKNQLGSFPTQLVILALKRYYSSKTFFPKLHEIVKECQPQKTTKYTDTDEKRLQEKKEHALHWQRIDNLNPTWTMEERQLHKETEMRHDWRRALLAKRPLTSPFWRAIIADRTTKNLGPLDMEPDREIPPHPSTPGNLAEALGVELPETEEDLI